jgi:LPS O-antigen subunit length determinant protein (WzzB/FepE family)
MNVIRRHSKLFSFTLVGGVIALLAVYMLSLTADTHARAPSGVDRALQQLEAKLDALDCGGDGGGSEMLEAKLDALEAKMDTSASAQDALEVKLDAVESKLDSLEVKMDDAFGQCED